MEYPKRSIVSFLSALVIFGVGYWLCLPAFWGWGMTWLVVIASLPAVAIALFTFFEDDEWAVVPTIQGAAAIIAVVCMGLYGLFGSALFHAPRYAATIDLVQSDEPIATEIPNIENIEDVVLMDTATAEMLMDRAFGGLTEYVSQYVRGEVTTIVFQGKDYKIAPLEYAGFWKWQKQDSIPGYLLCDPDDSSTKFVEVPGGIKYSPSAYLSEDLERHIRSKYKGIKFYGSHGPDVGILAHFQLNEEGAPYWVVPYFEYAVWGGAKTPAGCILVDAVTGSQEKYALGNIPSWVDNAVDGVVASSLYNRYGDLLNGFFNLSDTGRTQVTDDFGYIVKDGVINVYTGVTSVTSDESNIGFIMVNTNTGKFTYYAATDNPTETAAEEYSAMSAAEDLVQNYGYTAAFPSLVTVQGRPTYAMVLKSGSGLIAGYALVDMADISKSAFASTMDECLEKYTSATQVEVLPEETKAKNIIVSAIQHAVIDGNTVVYITDEEGVTYKQALKENESLILLEVGDALSISYYDTEGIKALAGCLIDIEEA